jgi:hypothetical protein
VEIKEAFSNLDILEKQHLDNSRNQRYMDSSDYTSLDKIIKSSIVKISELINTCALFINICMKTQQYKTKNLRNRAASIYVCVFCFLLWLYFFFWKAFYILSLLLFVINSIYYNLQKKKKNNEEKAPLYCK